MGEAMIILRLSGRRLNGDDDVYKCLRANACSIALLTYDEWCCLLDKRQDNRIHGSVSQDYDQAFENRVSRP